MRIVLTFGRFSIPGAAIRAELAAAVLDARVVRVAVLEHRQPQALDRAALDLPFDERRIDGAADVEALPQLLHEHLAGLVVDLHLGRAGGVRDRRVGRESTCAGLGVADRLRYGFSCAPVPVISSP